MSFGKFFKDALLPVAVWTCGVLLSCFVLTVAGAPVSIVVVAVGVSYIFGMLGIVIEYARRRCFLRQLERAAEELESPAWVQEMVQCPTYAEGELEYEVLRRVGKAACDEVAEGRRQTDDYRDYIESWVHEAKLPLAAAHLILENLDGSEDDLSRVDDLGRELGGGVVHTPDQHHRDDGADLEQAERGMTLAGHRDLMPQSAAKGPSRSMTALFVTQKTGLATIRA